ncbi:hypothetical protein [Clostridium nigeriense]|uniref:hypothetical protein n=1 Tax=Clostridium nigeriense TaxID=1805470 RepID=UPI000837925D|nr:hypothetical protein [Clostridium nigeriense]
MSEIKSKKNVYLPDERTGYAPEPHSLISHGKIEAPSTMLPNTVEDDIVVNNISYMEFDYTEQPELDLDDDI